MAFVNKPIVVGDGYEYIYMTEAFIQHDTPDLQQSAVEIAQEKMKKQNNLSNFPRVDVGFFVSEDGKYYSWHFWLYPMFVAPVQQFLHVFHGNELRAFGITNALLYIAMLWVIFCFAPQKSRYLLTGLMALSPLIQCIEWPHTEVFSATLLTMALVFWLRKNFKLAILLSALASCQNPPIIAFTILIGCMYLYNVYKQYKETQKIDLRDFIIVGLCALPVLFSPLFYYAKFSTLNLIKHIGYSDFNLISFHKFLSYFFDLNQGAMLYSGILLFVFIYYVIKNLAHKNFKYFELVISLVSFVLLTSTTPNWSMGFTVIRYFLWTYPLVVFYVVKSMDVEKQSVLSALLIINMFVLCCINCFFSTSFLPEHNMLSKTILSHAPYLYNPEHQIFYRRTNHVGYYSISNSYPIIFTTVDGYARKVLTDKSGWQSLHNNEDYIIHNNDFYNKELLKFNTNNTPRYINVYGNDIEKRPTILNIDKKIMFSDINESIQGLSGKESWGRWSNSKTVRFCLKFLSLNKRSEAVAIKFAGRPFVNNKHKNLKINIFANGKQVSVWNFNTEDKTKFDLVISLPMSEIIQNDFQSELRFEIDDPISPKELGLNKDIRKLGFGFESIEIMKGNKTKKPK